MLVLSKYHLKDNLYQGKRTEVYRGMRIGDRQPVIIKILRNPHPNFKELVQFRNQYIIASHLEHPHIVRPIALERYGNGYALVMPDDEAIALSDYWQQGEPNLAEFLSIAIQLADALQYLSGERVIHKDIKPANILIRPETRQVKLIDFSISSLLPKEQQQLINPNVLEGTLAYISPEQTGRMNRGIDYRTDFYSLGVTFFELLTGKLPFATSDPMELVHCHIAKMPPALGNGEWGMEWSKPTPVTPLPGEGKIGNGRAIPQAIENIVLKLMAKNAEERYQSALGLKHDLERCLQEWKAKGEIALFELGQEDRSDRFLIPEKLYGREKEVQELLAAFDRVAAGNNEMMLVAGFSGIGKTALVSEVHKPIVKQRGYFIKGKFDQFNRNIPFSAFVQAFRDLVGQLLGECDVELAAWKQKILSALGESGQVIIDVIPELEPIVGKQPPVPELSGSAAQNRFNLLFSKFVRVFTTKEHPLVIFLDDLQWVDSASLNLLQLLMDESEGGYLLVLGAYRDNEVFPAHPLMLSLDEIEKQGATLKTLTLAPLSENQIGRLVADTLLCSVEIASPLANLVYQKTRGNPFFSTQFLKGLHEDGWIEFEAEAGYWQCDLAQVRQLALTDDVVEFMMGRLQKMSAATQEILKIAACIGNEFNLETLAIVREQSPEEAAGDLWKALAEGLILPQSDIYKFYLGSTDSNNSSLTAQTPSSLYQFLHDRVQQAAYALIPEAEKKTTHLRIGQLLWHNTTEAEREAQIFDLVAQLNYGVDLIAAPGEREQLARLNLMAGRKAKAATAYSAAVAYLTVAQKLLAASCWQTQYDLALAIYEEAAEAAYLSTEFENMEQLVETVLQQAKALLDKVKVYEAKIQASMAQNKPLVGIAIALPVLRELGVELPESPQPEDIQQGLAETASLLGGKRPSELIELPEMTAPDKLAAMRIISKLIPAVYVAGPQLLPLVVLQQVNLSIKYGNAADSAFAYANYGQILCGVLGELEKAYEFGRLALEVLSRLNARSLAAKTYTVVYFCITHWREHLAKTLKPFQESFTIGLETGDVEYGAYSALNYCTHCYLNGRELSDVSREMDNYTLQLRKLKQETALNYLVIFRQAVLNLRGFADENPWTLSGFAYKEKVMLPLHQASNDVLAIAHMSLNKLLISYLFGEFVIAVDNAEIVATYLNEATAFAGIPIYYFYNSLARLALYPNACEAQREKTMQKVTATQKKMQKWADNAPMNYLHKFYLVEAERHRALGEKLEAIELYDCAIAGAKANEYIQEEALANELAAKFYLDWGKEKFAAGYMQEAYYCYARWGAKAKIEQLEEKYPQLLLPILQESKYRPSPSNPGITTQTLGTVTSTTSVLDLASAIKASQAISSEISLDALLSKLMGVVLENAGADKGALILNRSDTWEVAAICINGNSNLTNSPLNGTENLPSSIINTVKRTGESFIINNLERETAFASDPYLSQEQPLSLCCTPILHIGKLIGILYLENRAIADAFTPDRIEVLNLLTAQAAISIENARLYSRLSDYSHNLEAQVEQRTEELQEKNLDLQATLVQLQQTQAQLIQTEKMSSLGQMVAGIAHEINNPITFIAGNVGHAREYVGDLLDLLAVYEEESPNASEAIEEKMEEINLEFLREDLEKLFASMKNGSDRIRNIVLGLRNFSRLDEADRKQADIHEGLENTLTIVKHRLKAVAERPEIAIVKNYGKLPLVNCYASQLNQVFLHILTNAIDVLSTSYAGKSPEIRIATEVLDAQTVRIRIADNGSAMGESVRKKVFDPFFTTKPVGEGTGLGMSISYQIVTEQHGGQLQCFSEPGVGTEFAISLPIEDKLV
ncbi:MAG: AAA family ATPase [Oscillatoria sp. SIO1A7]|nr:AAA family ATPase [Oscillatoria sp. SIO1A7]